MIVILGGGPAGRTAAVRLGAAGREVVLVDKGGLGGQCLHHGCMVVCALADAAKTVRDYHTLERRGILGGEISVSFSTLLTGMAEIQQTITGVLREETETAGVTVISGKEGRFDGERVYAGDREIEAEHVLIATGSQPKIPLIDGIGLDGVYTAHTLARMQALPGRIAIIGGGVMGAEFAAIFSGLGSSVDLLCRSGFLGTLDRRVRDAARTDLPDVRIREHVTVERIDGEKSASIVRIASPEGPDEIRVDAVLIATGLKPHTETIDGLEKGKDGNIVVDARMRTSKPGVFAAGDATGPPYLTPVARREGIVAAENILGNDMEMDYTHIPSSVRLGYEHAFCFSENSSNAALRMPSPAGPGSFWSVPRRWTGTSMLTYDPSDGRITGAYAASPDAGLYLAYYAFLMRQGVTVEDMEDFLEIHPATDGLYSLAKYAAFRRQTQQDR